MLPTLNMNICPFCHTGHQTVERSMYDSEGKFIQNEALRSSWIVKCKRCYAKSKNGRSKIDAIAKWNRMEFTHMTWVINSPGYVSDYDLWIYGRSYGRGKVYGLANEIVAMQVDDLRTAAISQIKQGGLRGELKGEAWFYTEGYERLSCVPGKSIVRMVKEQAPYDLWREQHGCKSCKRKCYHETDKHWRQFRDGKAPDCPRNETIKRNEDGSMDVRAFLEVHRRE